MKLLPKLQYNFFLVKGYRPRITQISHSRDPDFPFYAKEDCAP